MTSSAPAQRNTISLVDRLILGIFIFSILFAAIFHAFMKWLKGRNEEEEGGLAVLTQNYTIVELPSVALETDVALISLQQESHSNTFVFNAKFSLKNWATCHILANVPLAEFHNVLTNSCTDLQEWICRYEKQRHTCNKGENTLHFELNDLVIPPPQAKRDNYALIVAFTTDKWDSPVEKIALSCYVVHVKLRPEELAETKVLYTFWKTNRDRLLTPQALYAAHEDETSVAPAGAHLSAMSSMADKQLTCFVCLSEDLSSGTLRALLPCRHAAVCANCFNSLQRQTFATPISRLTGLVACPLCRTPISALLCLPSLSNA